MTGWWFRRAINIDQFYSHEEIDPLMAEPADETTPLIRNVLLENIRSETIAGNAVWLAGLKESPLENIRFRNVHASGLTGMRILNAAPMELERVVIETPKDRQE